jgi:hypothetical protein
MCFKQERWTRIQVCYVEEEEEEEEDNNEIPPSEEGLHSLYSFLKIL